MKLLLSILCAVNLVLLASATHADTPPPHRPPPLERPDTLKLRDIRLREAVQRGEISAAEARRLRQLYRRHDAIRLQQPAWPQASMPHADAPPHAWHRWRKKQDRLHQPPPAEAGD